MDVLITYFSQTGNTERIAEAIRKVITESDNNCKLVRIRDFKKENVENFELIGIGTPTFFYREPVNVHNFIKKLNKQDGKHCFLFCTHGSMIGNTFYYMNEELKRKGFLAIGTFDTYASSSIQFYPQPMHTEGHPDDIEIKEAEQFGKKICEISHRINNNEKDLIPEFTEITDTWWAYESRRLTLDVLRSISPNFKIDISKCTKCLSCQENCPTNAIDIENDPPLIQLEGCIFCWFCEKSCPENAMIADWSFFKRTAKKNLTRYIEILKEAEKQNTFRPYVNYKEIC